MPLLETLDPHAVGPLYHGIIHQLRKYVSAARPVQPAGMLTLQGPQGQRSAFLTSTRAHASEQPDGMAPCTSVAKWLEHGIK